MSFIVEANVIDVVRHDIYPAKVSIRGKKIAKIEKTDKKYKHYILPGLIDAHIHIESSMMPPSEFAGITVSHGTTASVSDPHEIANVLGMAGIDFMLKDAARVPFKFFFGAPSCVPATDFETSGAKLKAKDIEELLKRPEIKYLSEMMNFPGVIYESKDVMAKLALAKKYGKAIDGHAPGLRGEQLEKYIAAGITTDHEAYSIEEAHEKVSLGMKILIREGSAAKNYEALHTLIDDFPEMCMFCSDDKHPDDLLKGHINKLIQRAVADGHDLIDAIRAATLNPVRHYGLDCGLLQPGDPADFIIIDSPAKFNILQTCIDGEIVFDMGKTLITHKKQELINNFHALKKNPGDFAVPAAGNKIRVIEAVEGELITNELYVRMRPIKNMLVPNAGRDILKLAVVNRYKNSKPALAFIKNFALKNGAIASSVAHDSHNIIALGTDDNFICDAVNTIIESKGGMVFVSENELIHLPLPIAGIMSELSCREIAELYTKLEHKIKESGCSLKSPFMTLSFMALLVIPALKLSDKGLFDGTKFELCSLFI